MNNKSSKTSRSNSTKKNKKKSAVNLIQIYLDAMTLETLMVLTMTHPWNIKVIVDRAI